MKGTTQNFKPNKNKLIVRYKVDSISEGTDGEDLLEVTVNSVGDTASQEYKTGDVLLVTRRNVEIIQSNYYDKDLFVIHDYTRVFAKKQ